MVITLYQFELCPFCHQVRAALEVKGLAYRTVEVNPMTKTELPELPDGAPRKVPVIDCAGDVVFDSTSIMNYLDERFHDGARLTPADAGAKKRSDEIEAWVDGEFVMALPTVIYGTWGESLKAAQVTARTSNFGFLHNVGVRAGGPLIMHQVSKRILKRHNKTNGHAWVAEALDQFESWLGNGDFVVGDTASLADVAMQGAVSCVRSFPIFEKIMARPKMRAWFERVQTLRDAHAVRAA